MTVTGETPQTSPREPSTGRASRRRDGTAVLEVCPYLAVDDGTWRSAYAARDHRCHAVRPPAVLAVAKQRELCLRAEHGGCATFVAARAVETEKVPPLPGDAGAGLWSPAATTPLVLEPARRMGALPASTARGGGQALLIGLMVLAFLVLVIARTQTPAGVAGETPAPPVGTGPLATTPALGGGSTAPSPAVSEASPAATPVEESPSPAATAEPTAEPTAVPSATATTSRTYRVKSGDTLSTIAARYDTTVKQLATLNGITDPRYLRIGQVLQIP